MSKIDPFSLTRPSREVKEVSVQDPYQPGITLTMKLRALDPVDSHRAESVHGELVKKFIIDGLPFYPLAGGEPVEVSSELLLAVSGLYCMQVGDEKYTPEEIIAISATMPIAWAKLNSVANELSSNLMEGNASRVSTEPSSSQPSRSTEDTQVSTSESIGSSGLSMSD